MLEREHNERRVNKKSMLIYPLISYKKQFWLEDHYEEEAKVLTKELDAEREKRLKDGGKAAMDQVKKDLYDKNA